MGPDVHLRWSWFGADVVIDVRRSRDGEFVVIHDPTLGRTPTWAYIAGKRSSPRVDELTLAELRRLDAGSWKGSSFVGERNPTLEGGMDLVAASQAHLLDEAKRPLGAHPAPPHRPRGPAPRNRASHRRITVQSFGVHDLRDLLPSVSLSDRIRGWGMRCVPWTVNHPGAMRRVLGLGVDGVITDHPDVLLDLMVPA